jgi:cysteine desulfurase
MIYLDYQATTPVDPAVLKAMLPYFTDRFGNSASVQHQAGQQASEAVERARRQVAALIRADRREIIFCSGATEANNLALKGLAERAGRRGLVTLATEHPAVLDPLRELAENGFELKLIRVGRDGQPNLDELDAAIDDQTLLVSVAAANNEVGTLPPLRTIAEIAHSHGAVLHTDAAQAVGKIDLDVERDGIDLLSLSGHKLYGPKGVGALYVCRELQRQLNPVHHGGGHERGLRSGTLNTPGIVGLGAAAELAADLRAREAERLCAQAEDFLTRLSDRVDGVELNGPRAPRLPGNLNLRINGVDAEALIANCPDLCFSAGSACSAATPTPSHVLLAIGLTEDAADQSARFGLGRPTTTDEIDEAVDLLASAIARIRQRTADPIGAR